MTVAEALAPEFRHNGRDFHRRRRQLPSRFPAPGAPPLLTVPEGSLHCGRGEALAKAWLFAALGRCPGTQAAEFAIVADIILRLISVGCEHQQDGVRGVL